MVLGRNVVGWTILELLYFIFCLHIRIPGVGLPQYSLDVQVNTELKYENNNDEEQKISVISRICMLV